VSQWRNTYLCECGRPRARRRPTCNRCRLLDGKTSPEASVIWALRMKGGAMSVRELMAMTGYQDWTIRRAAERLTRLGRLMPRRKDMGARGDYEDVIAYALKG